MKINIPSYSLYDGSPESITYKTVKAKIIKVSEPREPHAGQRVGMNYRDITFKSLEKDFKRNFHYDSLREDRLPTILKVVGVRDVKSLVGKEVILLFEGDSEGDMDFNQPDRFLNSLDNIVLER